MSETKPSPALNRPSWREIDVALRDRPVELVEHLTGETPNKSLSDRTTLRFGRKGGLAVVIAGPDKGRITPFDGSGEPNEQQAAFVNEYVATGGNGSEAARRAGYSKKSASQVAYKLLQKPHVLFAVHAEQARVIGSEAATLAVGVIVGILKDEDAKSSVRLDAAKAALALAGHVAPKAPELVDDPADYPMSEWTAAELEKFIWEGKAAIAEAKKNDEEPDESESVH